MNIERLNYFIDLSKTLNFTETAERLFTTQSNVSKNINALEKEISMLLFSRAHKQIALTDNGKTLLPHAKKIYEDYLAFQQSVSLLKSIKQFTLTIHALPVMVNYNVTDLITAFQQRYEDHELTVKEVEPIDLLKNLDEGICDLACSRVFDLDTEKYDMITIATDHFVVILPKEHSLVHKSVIDLTMLKNEKFLLLDQNTLLMQPYLKLCHNAGFEPHITYTGVRIETILDFVSKGMGVSLMMEKAINLKSNPNIVVKPLKNSMSSKIAFLRLKQRVQNQTSNLFWHFLKTYVTNALNE